MYREFHRVIEKLTISQGFVNSEQKQIFREILKLELVTARFMSIWCEVLTNLSDVGIHSSTT